MRLGDRGRIAGWVALWLAAMSLAGVGAGVVAAGIGRIAGVGCVQRDPALCDSRDLFLPFLAGSMLGAAVAGVPLPIWKLRSASSREQRGILAWCVALGAGLIAGLAAFAGWAGAPGFALGCLAVIVVASGLLFPRHRAVLVVVLVGLLASGVALVRAEFATVFLVAPARLLWGAAGVVALHRPDR